MSNIIHKSKDTLKEIGILEIERHPPVLASFSKIFKTEKTNVTIFTTNKILERIKVQIKNLDDYKIITKNEKQTNFSFLKKVQDYCDKNIDLLFVNTIHETILDLPFYLNFNPKCKKILTIHHANAWLNPKIVFKPKKMIKTIDTNLSSALIKLILPKYDAINVIYPPIKKYIQNNFDYTKKIFTFPSSIFEEENIKFDKNNEKSKINIVIPGLIQKHRKDFETVLPVIEEIFDTYNERTKLYLLGRAVDSYGKNIQRKFEKLKEKGKNIVTFNHFIEEKKFFNIIKKSDIILAPIRIKSKADSEIIEYYGKTVGSGVMYNSIMFAKPIITPDKFKMIKELETSTLKYNNSEKLKNILSEYIENPELRKKLNREAIINAKKFSLNNLQNYFKKDLLTWL